MKHKKCKDTERLNWLQKHGCGIGEGYDEDKHKTIWWVDESWDFREVRYSLRAAIDAAMKKFLP